MAFKHSKDTRVYMHGLDLSPLLTGSQIGPIVGLNDVTAFADTGRKHIRALGEPTISLDTLFDNADLTSGADYFLNLLKGGAGTFPITKYPGGDAIGLYGYSGSLSSQEYVLNSPVGELVTGRLDGVLEDVADRLKSLAAKGTVTATTNGTSIDDAAASTAGFVFTFHIFANSASGGNARWQIELQDSADDSSWATVDTSNYPSGIVGGERAAVAGTLRRYVRQRLVLDASSGSITIQAGYARL